VVVLAVFVGVSQADGPVVDDVDLERIFADSYISKFITTCDASDPCITKNAECVNKRCQCSHGFVPYKDYNYNYYPAYQYASSYSQDLESGTAQETSPATPAKVDPTDEKIRDVQCVAYAAFDEACVTDIQCKATLGTGATCQKFMDGVNGACACQSYGYMERNGKCVLVKALGEECDGDLSCKTKNAKCQELPANFDGDKSSYSSWAVSTKKYGKARACQCPQDMSVYDSVKESCVKQ